MKDLYDLLEEKKTKWQAIEAPADFESRLNQALEQASPRPTRKRRLTLSLISAAAVLLIFLIGLTYPTLAYYGKQILGFDSVMSHNLKALNHAGKGQIINKRFTFKDGTVVTLDGIMSDPNEMIAFVTVKNNSRKISNYSFTSDGFTGLWTRLNPTSGYGKMSQSGHTMKYVENFKAPGPFTNRHLTYSFTLTNAQDHQESGEIGLNYNRDKAMPTSVQKTLNQTIDLDGNRLFVKQLTATPTSTVLTGSFHSKVLKQLMDSSPDSWIQLIANGKVIGEQGGGFQSNGLNIKFQEQFDPLPQPLKNLQVVINKAPNHDSSVKHWPLESLQKGTVLAIQPQSITVMDKEIENTHLTLILSIPDTVKLGSLSIQANGQTIKGKIIGANLQKQKDGTLARQITYQFDTGHTNGQLTLAGYNYFKTYHKVIKVSIEN